MQNRNQVLVNFLQIVKIQLISSVTRIELLIFLLVLDVELPHCCRCCWAQVDFVLTLTLNVTIRLGFNSFRSRKSCAPVFGFLLLVNFCRWICFLFNVLPLA